MSRKLPLLPDQACGWGASPQRQSLRQLRSSRPASNEVSSSVGLSSSITEAGSEEKNREDGYEEGVECEQEDKGGRGVKRKGKISGRSPSGVLGSPSPSHKKSKGNGSDRVYACPYFKNDPQGHRPCAEWRNRGTHRVKEHCKRAHLKPLQCLNCGNYRTGDQGQMKTHTDKCGVRAEEITRVPRTNIEKARLLEERGLDWNQIYKILFPGAKVPCPYWGEGVAPRTLSRPQDHPPRPPFTHDGSVADFARFLQDRIGMIPDRMQALLLEYRDACPRSHNQSLPLRTILAENDGIGVGHRYNSPHSLNPYPTAQTSDILGPYTLDQPLHGFYNDFCDGGSDFQPFPNRLSPSASNTDGTPSALSVLSYQFPQTGRPDLNFIPHRGSYP